MWMGGQMVPGVLAATDTFDFNFYQKDIPTIYIQAYSSSISLRAWVRGTRLYLFVPDEKFSSVTMRWT